MCVCALKIAFGRAAAAAAVVVCVILCTCVYACLPDCACASSLAQLKHEGNFIPKRVFYSTFQIGGVNLQYINVYEIYMYAEVERESERGREIEQAVLAMCCTHFVC